MIHFFSAGSVFLTKMVIELLPKLAFGLPVNHFQSANLLWNSLLRRIIDYQATLIK